MSWVARGFYAIFGLVALGLGLLALVKPALALPPEAYSPLTAHLIREQGAEGVFLGLVSFWCFFHFDDRRPIHFALLIFAALFAAIHWGEYFEHRRGVVSPLVNSVPFVVLLVTLPRRPDEKPRAV